MSHEAGPLLELAQKLRLPRPLSVAHLVRLFASADDYKDFVAVVREILPECEQEILRHRDPEDQIRTFVTRFNDRYFPLEDGFYDMVGEDEEEPYWLFLRGIPLQVMGVGFDDYHEMPDRYRPGLQLMTYLLEAPWEAEGGARIALAEACRQHVPLDLLQRGPEGGLSFSDAHELLNGTAYEALAQWGDILGKNTNNDFLNMDYESFCECEPPPWEHEVVDFLTQLWQEAELIYNSCIHLAEWLEVDPPARFRELLDFIEGKHVDEPDPRQGILALVFADEP